MTEGMQNQRQRLRATTKAAIKADKSNSAHSDNVGMPSVPSAQDSVQKLRASMDDWF